MRNAKRCAGVVGWLAFAALAQDARQASYDPGVTLRVYDVGRPMERVHEPAPGQTANVDRRAPRILFDQGEFGVDDFFVAEVTGQIRVDVPGRHVFRLISDDGSFLTIGGERVVWNRGLHPPLPVDGTVELAAGWHDLRILMFEASGGEYLELQWRGPDGADDRPFETVPSSHLRTEAGVTRVVSPGRKRISADIEGLRPGDGIALETVHPGWRVQTLRPDDWEPMVGCLAELGDGRLIVGTFEPKNNGVWLTEPNGTLWALSNLDADDPNDIGVEVFAEGLYHPLGMCVVDGVLYVAERDRITAFSDGDGDGSYETRRTLAEGWVSDNYHHFTFGLEHHDGSLYATLSTSIGVGDDEILSGEVRGINGPNPPGRGTLLKIDITTGDVEHVCGGFRTPNGVLVTPDGSVFVGENQGAWMPASKINHALPGRFYGHYNETRVRTTRYPDGGAPALMSDRPVSPPAVWLPQNEIANSPTDFLHIDDGPFAGQLYVGELKLGGIRRVFLDTVNGVVQGGVVRFSQGFEGGVNRLMWGPGGSIYVGCIGERATWSWRGTRTGLQRMTPTGASAFEYHSVSATPDGFEIRFTAPVDRAWLADAGNYELKQWRYRATPAYGGAKLDEHELAVTDARPAPDGMSVRLTVPGREPGYVVYLRCDPTSVAGERIWATECWYTLNEIPGRTRARDPGPTGRVLVFSKTAGFRHTSIEAGVEAVERVGRSLGFEVEHTEDDAWFTDERLARYDAVVFLNTTGDVLDLSQEAAFVRYIQAGHGFVGVHSAADTEYDWPWYGRLVGAYFRSHPAVQRATVDVIDRDHRCTRHLPRKWIRTDEWYDFRAPPPADVRVLMTVDESTYSGGRMGVFHPIAWCHEFDGGRAIYTAGGHTEASFREAPFIRHVGEAILWAMGRADD